MSAATETADRINEALDALSTLGAAWRGDWSDFDGRTLRDELSSWRELYDRASLGEAVAGDANRWLQSLNVCAVCRTWREWCSDRAQHFSEDSA